MSQLDPEVLVDLEYVLQWRDRFLSKSQSKRPIAVLKEFWEEQEDSLSGIFEGNIFSQI